jgi:hypothetical protein
VVRNGKKSLSTTGGTTAEDAARIDRGQSDRGKMAFEKPRRVENKDRLWEPGKTSGRPCLTRRSWAVDRAASDGLGPGWIVRVATS